MRVKQLVIANFRGVREGVVIFSDHTLLVGGNNFGKSTVCDALELILGPERLSRRPLVDEHDFHCGQYLDPKGAPKEIRISAVLTDLSAEAEKRFYKHLRRWNQQSNSFADEGSTGPEAADGPGTCWCLPLVFIAQYDVDTDDFIGNTFFDHPAVPPSGDTEDDAEQQLGGGRQKFSRDHKRFCGFVFLHALRTGSRALSLQRGSLLDTVLRLPGNGLSAMWQDTLKRLREIDPSIGEIEQLKQISDEIRARMGQFINLSSQEAPTAFYASELTREHLREVVRLFVSVRPGNYLLPFQRLGTGSVNLLVFAMLTFIAELKDQHNVIFAMEEPELALPPHTQRRVTRFVLTQMGQAIVTSHSPYVIEQFDPSQIVVLNRNDDGTLDGKPLDLQGVKPKAFARERKQLAETILASAILVVEGGTEAAVFPAASTVLEESLGPAYSHLDIAGVSVFDAGGEGSAPVYGPFFTGLGKPAFCVLDQPNKPASPESVAQVKAFKRSWELPEKGIEALLVKEISVTVLRRFLSSVKDRADYPKNVGPVADDLADDAVPPLVRSILEARKGNLYGYGALLIAECQNADELPRTIRNILETIHSDLNQAPPAPATEPAVARND